MQQPLRIQRPPPKYIMVNEVRGLQEGHRDYVNLPLVIYNLSICNLSFSIFYCRIHAHWIVDDLNSEIFVRTEARLIRWGSVAKGSSTKLICTD